LTLVTREAIPIEQETPSRSGERLSGGYDPAFFDQLARIEDQHFWFRARNRLIYEMVRRIAFELPPEYFVVEVGCGTGNVLRALREACPNGKVIGLELWLDGLRYARGRSDRLLVQGDVRNLPFGKPFHLVGLFDVLEHVDEDREALVSLWRSLVPGGRILLTIPAHQFLWSYFDEAAHHCRRYSAQDIREKLAQAGFQVEFVSQFMASIFPFVWMFRKIRGVRARAEPNAARARATNEFKLVPFVNLVLTALLSLEARWVAHGHHLPFGTSLVAIARRPPLD